MHVGGGRKCEFPSSFQDFSSKAYSIDLRKHVQVAVASEKSRRAAARRYDVGTSFAGSLAIMHPGGASLSRLTR